MAVRGSGRDGYRDAKGTETKCENCVHGIEPFTQPGRFRSFFQCGRLERYPTGRRTTCNHAKFQK